MKPGIAIKSVLLSLAFVASFANAATVLFPSQGGTGIANANTKTITLGGPLVTSGAFTTTLTVTATTNATLPEGTTTLLYSGGPLGTPSSGTGANITGVNAATLGGATFAAPGPIGGGTPGSFAGTTGTFTGALSTTSSAGFAVKPAGVNAPIVLGNGAAGESSSIVMRASNAQYAWQIGASQTVASALELTPSTAIGGLTFTTPVVTLLTTGASITGTLSTTDAVIMSTSASPASGAACTAGTLSWDSGFFYVCTASGASKRVAITGGY